MKPLLMTKVKNQIKKYWPNAEFKLHNININGDKKGCSGFIKNPDNNSIVYIDTESANISYLGYMYRYADNFTDYTGYHNRWAKTPDDLFESINLLLQKTPQEVNDRRL